MTSSEQAAGASPDVSTASGDPYRTPVEVPSAKGRGWMRSPLMWMFVAGLLAAGIMAVALRPVSTHVEDFGASRIPPPMDDIEYAAETAPTP